MLHRLALPRLYKAIEWQHFACEQLSLTLSAHPHYSLLVKELAWRVKIQVFDQAVNPPSSELPGLYSPDLQQRYVAAKLDCISKLTNLKTLSIGFCLAPLRSDEAVPVDAQSLATIDIFSKEELAPASPIPAIHSLVFDFAIWEETEDPEKLRSDFVLDQCDRTMGYFMASPNIHNLTLKYADAIQPTFAHAYCSTIRTLTIRHPSFSEEAENQIGQLIRGCSSISHLEIELSQDGNDFSFFSSVVLQNHPLRNVTHLDLHLIALSERVDAALGTLFPAIQSFKLQLRADELDSFIESAFPLSVPCPHLRAISWISFETYAYISQDAHPLQRALNVFTIRQLFPSLIDCSLTSGVGEMDTVNQHYEIGLDDTEIFSKNNAVYKYIIDDFNLW